MGKQLRPTLGAWTPHSPGLHWPSWSWRAGAIMPHSSLTCICESQHWGRFPVSFRVAPMITLFGFSGGVSGRQRARGCLPCLQAGHTHSWPPRSCRTTSPVHTHCAGCCALAVFRVCSVGTQDKGKDKTEEISERIWAMKNLLPQIC